MRKISVLLVCALALMCVSGFADEGTMTWGDLKTMIAAGGSVTLTNDVTRDALGSIEVTSAVTLDLNGCMIDGGGSVYRFYPVFSIVNGGSLTITDSRASERSCLTNVWNTSAIQINNGSVVLSGGKIQGLISTTTEG